MSTPEDLPRVRALALRTGWLLRERRLVVSGLLTLTIDDEHLQAAR